MPAMKGRNKLEPVQPVSQPVKQKLPEPEVKQKSALDAVEKFQPQQEKKPEVSKKEEKKKPKSDELEDFDDDDNIEEILPEGNDEFKLDHDAGFGGS